MSYMEQKADEQIDAGINSEMELNHNAQEIAQWVIDNRYPKSEKEKVSDLEMFYYLVDEITKLIRKCKA